MEENPEKQLIQASLDGDTDSLTVLLTEVKNSVFNLSLRMLGNVFDAEDATQEVLLKAVTNLSSFNQQSRFNTWVYRIAVNYLINDHKKRAFREQLTFDLMGKDLEQPISKLDQQFCELEETELAEELKLSCTNIMLQCLSPQDRCVFILGTMFKMNSQLAGDLLQMSPATYRKKLSRIRIRMGNFLNIYCGVAGGSCECKKRIPFAIQQKRLNPSQLDYSSLKKLDLAEIMQQKSNMEFLDGQTLLFETLTHYQSAFDPQKFLKELLESKQLSELITEEAIYDL
ncbi:sigma-70 family RNA polymerase sigma factor [Enterococcus hulanensis]|uniref:RNA polymerase sigma factor n=1 Tax=Enterococcus hulanensis TaxID=2559929 RepID=UPI001A8E67D7|nr:sigma-70 family RNA polymerase sigma factor [Enterococcus hulanensis]MBO0455602.1 sigma-70 family RNA polymerase sigma factor [Enterococcus hulanensis]